MTNQTPAKKTKAKGPVRWEAVIPFTIVVLLTVLYVHFFFDGHLRRALEWGLGAGLGAQVDVADLKTSFTSAHLSVKGIDLTDSEQPSRNSLSVGEIRFGMSWDALLRAKILVNEAVVDKIEFGKPRGRPGWVKPPEPPKADDGSPSMAEKLKQEALEKVQQKYDQNVFGDLAAILGGGSAQVQLDKIDQSLNSKKMAQALEAQVKAKQQEWNERLKALPKASEFQALGDRMKAVKTKDFKSPQELQQSLQQLDAIFKEADAKVKSLQQAGQDLDGDVKKIDAEVKALEAQIKADVKSLEAHFKIPQIDAKALVMALFRKQIDKYMGKVQTYKALADKYVPPNLLKKGTDKPDPSMQPRPRAQGVSYEFGRPNSYPLFWVKRTAVSSQAGASAYAGNIQGEILDITSNQVLINKPTIANIAGDFPGMGISGFSTKLTVDNRQEASLVELLAAVKSYAIDGRDLISGGDVNIAFAKATGGVGVKATLKALKELDLSFDNRFQNIDYQIAAKSELVDTLLKSIFKSIPVVTVDGRFSGTFPRINTSLNSNLGPELQKGLEREVNAKIAEARLKIEKYVQDEVGKYKAQIDAEVAKIKQQVSGELKKVQEQADAQKKQAEARADQAKKDAENSAKKSVEKEATKAAEELKKRLGL
ncbi:MAG: TIGR03545 family protein [Bdellovibrionaceae bacterium]|nr:TIGR03545 family protein [Pseudobdellovibrionaceae bacterium]